MTKISLLYVFAFAHYSQLFIWISWKYPVPLFWRFIFISPPRSRISRECFIVGFNLLLLILSILLKPKLFSFLFYRMNWFYLIISSVFFSVSSCDFHFHYGIFFYYFPAPSKSWKLSRTLAFDLGIRIPNKSQCSPSFIISKYCR